MDDIDDDELSRAEYGTIFTLQASSESWKKIKLTDEALNSTFDMLWDDYRIITAGSRVKDPVEEHDRRDGMLSLTQAFSGHRYRVDGTEPGGQWLRRSYFAAKEKRQESGTFNAHDPTPALSEAKRRQCLGN